jgi:predicted ferric reductase
LSSGADGAGQGEHAHGGRGHFALRAAIITALSLAYLAVATAPVLLAWAQGLPRRPFLDDFSSAIALAAFAMLLAEFYLSGRFRAVSAGVGIDLVMRMHQLLARTALVLVALHPFLYSLPFTSGGIGAPSRIHAVLLTPAATVTGMLALVLLGALMIFAIFRDQLGWRYETWRLTHGLGAAALAALGFHHALDIGRYSAHTWLAGFWGIALVLAVLALAHIYFVKPLLMAQRGRRHRIAALRKVALKTWPSLPPPPLPRRRAAAADGTSRASSRGSGSGARFLTCTNFLSRSPRRPPRTATRRCS